MRAAENVTLTVNVQVSDLDTQDGISVKSSYRHMSVVIDEDNRDTVDIDGILVANDWTGLNGVLNFKDSVADATSPYEIMVLDGNDYLGTYSASDKAVFGEKLFSNRRSVTLVISFEVDKVGVDGYVGADGTDDREQKGYTVRLETSIGSGLYEIQPTTYYVNANDDLAKKVTDGDYTELPGLYAVTYDSDGNEYVYQYRIDGDTIYGDWVKEGSARFTTKTPSNDKDTNGDGKVSCDEYYGTTGLEWSDKLNACVVSSTGDAVVTIPNTATK